MNVDGAACVFRMYCTKAGRLIPSRTSGVGGSMVKVNKIVGADFHGGRAEASGCTFLFIFILLW